MKEKLYKIAAKASLNKTFEIIEITEEGNNMFTIYIESLEGITISDCTNLSKFILSNLPKDLNISLTVSSAGIDKPLRSPIQFFKNIGKKIEVKTKEGKKHVGFLQKYDDKGITITKELNNDTCKEIFNHEEVNQVKVKIF